MIHRGRESDYGFTAETQRGEAATEARNISRKDAKAAKKKRIVI